MRPCMVIGFGVLLLLTLSAGPLGAAAAAEPAELIVRFESGATAADRLEARNGARADFERQLPVQGMQLVEVESGQSAAAAERSLESADGVLYAEPNAIVSAFLRPDDRTSPSSGRWRTRASRSAARPARPTPTSTRPTPGTRGSP